VAAINSVAGASCAEAPNCRFWDSWLSVADSQGRFTSYAMDENGRRLRLRGRDFIHLTEEGGRIMAQKFLAETEDWADYGAEEPGEPPDRGTERPLAATVPLTRLGVPTLPPQGSTPEVEPAPEPTEEGEPVEPEPGPAPGTGDGAEEDFGADWSEGVFYAPSLGSESVFRLAEPRAGPNRTGPFPVILLLHGAWDSAAAWERELGRETILALADGLGVVLAMPDAPPLGWYLDGLETAAAAFLTNDFLPQVWRGRPRADRSRVALAGLSMGGHGALTLALKRPDLFQAAGALSAVTDLAAHADGRHKADSELGLDRALGPAGPKGRNWRPFGAAGLWEIKADAWNGRPLFLGVGSADGLTLAENRAFNRQLARLGISHVYQEKPGGHDWAYWSAELPVLLEFLAKAMR
jgi:S-formylglutathione hydrolase FrmB